MNFILSYNDKYSTFGTDLVCGLRHLVNSDGLREKEEEVEYEEEGEEEEDKH